MQYRTLTVDDSSKPKNLPFNCPKRYILLENNLLKIWNNFIFPYISLKLKNHNDKFNTFISNIEKTP